MDTNLYAKPRVANPTKTTMSRRCNWQCRLLSCTLVCVITIQGLGGIRAATFTRQSQSSETSTYVYEGKTNFMHVINQNFIHFLKKPFIIVLGINTKLSYFGNGLV